MPEVVFALVVGGSVLFLCWAVVRGVHWLAGPAAALSYVTILVVAGLLQFALALIGVLAEGWTLSVTIHGFIASVALCASVYFGDEPGTRPSAIRQPLSDRPRPDR